VDEARRLLERIGRIEALAGERGRRQTLLPELRALVLEAEAWSRREGGAEAAAGGAIDALRAAVATTSLVDGPLQGGDRAQSARGP